MTDDPRPVILDVTPGDHEGFERRLLEGTGHAVSVCHGPEATGGCPLLETGECEQLSAAHGVVFKLDLDRAEHRRILEAYKRTIPADMPLAVGVYPGQETKYADLLEGLYVWGHTPTVSELDGFAALVDAADATRTERTPRA
jgi:hypothetical protein